FFIPFGLMYPRSIAAQTSGSDTCPTGTTPKCQAPAFVPANALGIQFSWYGTMDTPGFLTPNPVGTYNILVDDVAFYKRSALPSGTSDLPALPTTAGAMHPFPQNATPGNGCFKAQGPAADGRLLALAYANWKAKVVRSEGGGLRVVVPASETGSNAEDTVSEGIGYAMLISVYMNDKASFDGFWTYWKAHCASGSGNTCLMTWRI